MSNGDLLNAIGQIDQDLIDRAARYREKGGESREQVRKARQPLYRRIGLIAACLIVVLCAVPVVMHLLNGISAAGEIRETDRLVKIVFLTSSPEYALDSYRVKASDYLLKPVRQEALFHTMDELFRELRRETRSIALRTPGTVYRVELDKIEYMEAQNKRVLFVLTDGRTMVSVDPLYFYEQKLTPQDGFFKCNRSYIVNIYRIDSFSPKEARMRSGARIPISRSCHREFEAAYFSAIFGKAGDF